jgi:hypothetical protein
MFKLIIDVQYVSRVKQHETTSLRRVRGVTRYSVICDSTWE